LRRKLFINDEGAYKRMIKCANVVELRNLEEYLNKARWKRKNKIRKM
jgi:hypothetical protein